MNREIKFRIWDKSSDTMNLIPHLSVNGGIVERNYEHEILMQCTGIYDKTGKDIYESDIVKLYYKGVYRFCEIVFAEGMFCLKWDDGYVNKYQLYPQSLEVTGNIYENKK